MLKYQSALQAAQLKRAQLQSADSPVFSKEGTPHIGVMCIDLVQSLEQKFGDWCHSYLPASYVKQLEVAGARVVPIWIGRDVNYYKTMMQQLNGILLPGGAVCLDEEEAREFPKLSNDCVQSARYIYDLAMEKNSRDDYFPLWGTCLGFQLLIINAAGSKEVRTDCKRRFEALPLRLCKDFKDSKLCAKLEPDMAARMGVEPFACHQHRFAITESKFRCFHLHRDWHVLATQQDGDSGGENEGGDYITLIEHRRFPIFGSQFHPERAGYEKLKETSRDTCCAAHTSSCIQLAQFFIDAFVDSCRGNKNSFASVEVEKQHMISNWQPVDVEDNPKSHWKQVYLFQKDVNYPQGDSSLN